MDYEKKYKNALEKLQEALAPKDGREISGLTRGCIESIFPELAESKDDRIRKEIIEYIKTGTYHKDWIAWLEKKESVEEIVERCKDSWYNEGKIAGKFEGIADDVKYQQGWHDALEKQVPVDKDKVAKGVKRGVATSLINYIDANSKGMCLSNMECEDIDDAIVNGKWYKVYNYMKKKLEKQVEKPQGKSALEAWNEEKDDNTNKVEPKFKVGDTMRTLQEANDDYTDGMPVVVSIDNEYYHCTNELIAIKDQDDYEFPPINVKQKPTDKVEPKFKVGDWVVWENQYYKVNYNGCGYELVGQNGLDTSLEYGTVDENAHHWDIAKDAKDGDVLVSDNIVFIFNKIHDAWINCHCSTHKDGSFMEEDYDLMTIKYGKEVFPATKEQRELLFQKMRMAGYMFDFKKKELNKVEPKFKIKLAGREYNVLEIKESAGVTFYGIEDEPNHIDYVLSDDCEIISGYGEKEKGSPYPTKLVIFSEQNPAWSEEDECYMTECISAIATKDGWSFEEKRKTKHWLESLKQRIGG